MTRLVVRGQVYRRVAPDSMLEGEFERLIAQDAAGLFPGYRLVEFKKTVTSEFGRNQADFALVHVAYSEWWVVEVEIATHSFDQHVFPQVQSLASASYGQDEAVYLASREQGLNAHSLEMMMLGAQPRVMVIVNRDCPSWHPPLSALGVRLLVAEVYRSDLDSHALVVAGRLPSVDQSVVSRCVPEPVLGRTFLSVESPAALDVEPSGQVEIEHSGVVSTWRRLDVSDRVWLHPEGGGLGHSRPVFLVRTEGGGLAFRDMRPNDSRRV